MSAPGHRPYGACDDVPVPPADPCQFMLPVARELLGLARRHHLLAVQGAIAAGVPLNELAHDCEATANAMRNLLALAGGEA